MSKAVGTGLLALAFVICGAATSPGDGQKPAGPPRELPLFLEAFRAAKQPPIGSRTVTWPSAVGRVTGILSRPETDERLPAVVLIPGNEGLSEWMKQSSRELASVGYVTLLIEPVKAENANEERTLARLSAGVRWLRRRPDVFPEAIGVAGWAEGARQALALASSMPVQACVLCDGTVTDEPATLAGLRNTPLLALLAGKAVPAKQTGAFQDALQAARIPHKVRVYEDASTGFMNPLKKSYAEETADHAWVEIYEFFGKHVEDAPFRGPTATPEKGPHSAEHVATVADIMRAVNDSRGVRGALMQSLEQLPRSAKEWSRVRARAALLVEAGRMLGERTPPRGSAASWAEHAHKYEHAAQAAVAAADKRDYEGTRRALMQLGLACASCHDRHR